MSWYPFTWIAWCGVGATALTTSAMCVYLICSHSRSVLHIRLPRSRSSTGAKFSIRTLFSPRGKLNVALTHTVLCSRPSVEREGVVTAVATADPVWPGHFRGRWYLFLQTELLLLFTSQWFVHPVRDFIILSLANTILQLSFALSICTLGGGGTPQAGNKGLQLQSSIAFFTGCFSCNVSYWYSVRFILLCACSV